MNDFSQHEAPGEDISSRLGLTAIRAPMKRNRKWIIWGVVAAVLLGGGYWMFFKGSTPTNYVAQPVTRGALTLTVSTTGTLAPRIQVDVGAEVSGRIDELYVDYNDHVTKGEKLAQINTDQIVAQLGQARATLQQAQATLAQSWAKVKRYAALLKTAAMSQQDYDAAQGDYLRAKGGVALAAAQVQQYETQLTKATIYSPIDGTVLDRKVSTGQTVVAAMTTPVIFTLASDLKQMELDVNIDEADVGSVHSNQSAEFTVDAYSNKKFTAQLVSVHNAPQTVQNVVTYKGVLLVNNPELLLKPGMTATAEILTGKIDNALLVPNAALRFVPADAIVKAAPPAATGASRGRVWTLLGKLGLKPHDLKLGGTNGRFTVVLGGDVKPGDQVVTDSKTSGVQ